MTEIDIARRAQQAHSPTVPWDTLPEEERTRWVLAIRAALWAVPFLPPGGPQHSEVAAS